MATQDLGKYIPAVRANGVRLNANEPLVAAGTNTLSGAVVLSGGVTASGSGSIDLSGSTGTFKTPTGAATLGGSLTVSTGKTLAVTDSAALSVGGAIVPQYEYITSPLLAAATFANGSSYPIYTFPNDGTTWKVVYASLRFTTAASSAATCDVTLDASGTAPGAGTSQLTAPIAINGTTNTGTNGVCSVGTASAAGGCISLKAGGAATTGLVNMIVTVCLQRLS